MMIKQYTLENKGKSIFEKQITASMFSLVKFLQNKYSWVNNFMKRSAPFYEDQN